jgi:uroporphyrinogen-III synthase
MRLIVTRPRQDARPLARRLEALGHEVLLAPLLSIRLTARLTIPERDYQAVLITSANGARAISGRPELARLKGAKALVVGPASAAAAARVGFTRIEQADGDVAALVGSAIAVLRPAGGPVLYVSGAVTAGELEAKLEAAGFDVDRVVAYEARPAERLPKACVAALAAGKADGVLLFSPRSARIWAALVSAAELTDAAAQLTHYCLSENVAGAMLGGLGAAVATQVSPLPEEASLLAMIPAPA